MIQIAFDTDVVGYAEGLDDAGRQARAADLIEAPRHHALVLPIQVAADFHR